MRRIFGFPKGPPYTLDEQRIFRPWVAPTRRRSLPVSPSFLRRTSPYATPHQSVVSYLGGCCGSAGCFGANFSRILAHRRGPIKEPPIALRSMTTPVPAARSKYADAS
jgi:hypothetical protein